MGMVLDAFASYVQNMLTEMVSEEVHMLLGVGDEIDKMHTKLRDLKNFLADADRRNITDKTMQEWMAELKRAMYEAADILDLCQLKAMEQGPSTVDVGCFNPLLFCMRNPAHAHNIGTRIKELNKKLGTIKERGDAFNFINLGSYEDRNSRVRATHFGIRNCETSGEFDRSALVGEKIEEDTRAIVDILVTEKECNTNIMVVAIVGVGGIGKTTLAQKVFKDEIINAEFDKTIWLSVNQNFDKVELIKTVITLAGGEYGGGTALAVLQPILTTTMKGKKLFIVMGDVWSPTTCLDVLGSHLANVVAPGSRILVTTRDERVARGMKAILPYHRVDKLEEDDGWSLLKNQMVEWEKWEWEEQVQAFPVLRKLLLKHCKLMSLPPGLSSQAKVLNKLMIHFVQGLTYVASFASLVRLEVGPLLDLERITDLPRLQMLTIDCCPKLKVVEGVPALQTLLLYGGNMKTLPEYMGGINPRCLELHCSPALLSSIAAGLSGPEWDKFSHIEHVKAYAREGDMVKKWYVLYTANPYNLETNVSRSFMSAGTLSCFEGAQRFESVFKMTRKTFDYICNLVFGPSMEDMDSYTFVDGRVLCLEDRVAVALIRLCSSEPSDTLGSSVGVSESTVLLIAEKFVDAVLERAAHHLYWPDSSKMDKTKSTFGKIHNLHNCCGVICTTHIPFGPNCDHGENGRILMQAVIDPKMRIVDLELNSRDSITQLSILQKSRLFNECQKGGLLNGSKLKVASDGSEVGEYLIGDAGYPLLPWLLKPYQEENLSDSKEEFNRRHSAATACARKALVMLQEKWKFLQEDVWWPENLQTRFKMIDACCSLHNIVIDMDDDAEMPITNAKDWNYHQQVRLVANEDAVRARDMLSGYFSARRSSKSGVSPVDAEEDHEVAASGAGDEDKEQEAQTGTADEEIIV
ncbi:hypothetical protein ACQ4PT_042344 [Festuca glaucescens]